MLPSRSVLLQLFPWVLLQFGIALVFPEPFVIEPEWHPLFLLSSLLLLPAVNQHILMGFILLQSCVFQNFSGTFFLLPAVSTGGLFLTNCPGASPTDRSWAMLSGKEDFRRSPGSIATRCDRATKLMLRGGYAMKMEAEQPASGVLFFLTV